MRSGNTNSGIRLNWFSWPLKVKPISKFNPATKKIWSLHSTLTLIAVAAMLSPVVQTPLTEETGFPDCGPVWLLSCELYTNLPYSISKYPKWTNAEIDNKGRGNIKIKRLGSFQVACTYTQDDSGRQAESRHSAHADLAMNKPLLILLGGKVWPMGRQQTARGFRPR